MGIFKWKKKFWLKARSSWLFDKTKLIYCYYATSDRFMLSEDCIQNIFSCSNVLRLCTPHKTSLYNGFNPLLLSKNITDRIPSLLQVYYYYCFEKKKSKKKGKEKLLKTTCFGGRLSTPVLLCWRSKSFESMMNDDVRFPFSLLQGCW